MDPFNTMLSKRLESIKKEGLYRRTLPFAHRESAYISFQGKKYLNLSSNDYLGLASNKKLLLDFYKQLEKTNCLEKFSPGAGASRLMTGNSKLYQDLEDQLASLYKRERCLIFNSGYHINIGILPSLASKKDLIVADKLCHASLIDGMRLSRADVLRYRHNDYDHLEEILRKKRTAYEQVFIVTESIFSMDGDTADLRKIVALKKEYAGTLLVDEAHAVGVTGEKGLGLSEEHKVVSDIDLFVGTFGKAYGSQGGFTVCSVPVAEYLINTSRSLIFTTGLPPVTLHWLSFVLKQIKSMHDARKKVRVLAQKLRDSLREEGLQTDGSTHIIPVLIGDSQKTFNLAQALQKRGYWVTAVRPPTVPAGTARLRLSISAAMQWQELADLPGHIVDCLGENI